MSEARQRTVRRLLVLSAAIAVGTFGWYLLGESEAAIAGQRESRGVAARVGDTVIHEDEVLRAAAARLRELDRQRHQILQSVLEQKVRQRLLELEAERLGTAPDLLVEQGVRAVAGDLTEADVEAFYERLRTRHDVEVLLAPFRREMAAEDDAPPPIRAPEEEAG